MVTSYKKIFGPRESRYNFSDYINQTWKIVVSWLGPGSTLMADYLVEHLLELFKYPMDTIHLPVLVLHPSLFTHSIQVNFL